MHYLPRGKLLKIMPSLPAEAGDVSSPDGLFPNPNRVGDGVPIISAKRKIDFTPNPFRRHSRGRRGAAHREEKVDIQAARLRGKERDLEKDFRSRTKAFELRGLRGYGDLSLSEKKREAHRARVARGEGGHSRTDFRTRVEVGMVPTSFKPRRRDERRTKTPKAAAAVVIAAAAAADYEQIYQDARQFARTGRLPVLGATLQSAYFGFLDNAVASGRIGRRVAERMKDKMRLVGVELNPGPSVRYVLTDCYCPIGQPLKGVYFPLMSQGVQKNVIPGFFPRRYYRLKSRLRVDISVDADAVEGDGATAAYHCYYVQADWESGPWDDYVRGILKLCFPHQLTLPAERLRKFATVALLLLMAGIEPNPGPAGSAPASDVTAGKPQKDVHVAARARDKKRKEAEGKAKARVRTPPAQTQKLAQTRGGSGALKESVKRVEAALVEQAKTAEAKTAAVADVLSDAEKAEIEKAAALLAARRASELARVQEDLTKLVGTAFHNVVPRQAFVSWAEVQPSARLLTRFPVPFRMTEVDSLTAYWHMDVEDKHELTSRTPADKRLFKPEEPHIMVRATAHVYCYGWAFQPIPGDALSFSCTFSWDQFCDFRTNRCDEYRFNLILDRVISFRRAGRTNPQDSRHYATADLLADNVFAALHAVSIGDNDQAGAIVVDMCVKGTTSLLERKMIHNAGGRLAPGTYVRGYQVGFDEMFPDEWADAVTSVSTGATTAKHALRAFFAAITKTGSEVAESTRRGLEERLVRAREKAAKYCRMHALHVEGLYPSFADPFDFGNILVAGCKRLLRRITDPTEDAFRYEEQVAESLIAEAAGFPANFAASSVSVAHEAQEYAFSKGFDLARTQEFVDGARLVASVRAGSVTIAEFRTLISESIEKMKAFIKAEDYPKSEVKCNRFIVCPNHFLRGVLWEAYREPCENFFRYMGHHCTKHRTPEENLEVTLSMFPEVQDGDMTHLKTDGKNFESLVNRGRRRLEQRVIRAFAHEEDHELLRCLSSELEKDFSITTEFITMVLTTIRRSGEYVTSCGNAICNHNMTLGMYAWALRIPLAEVKEWVVRFKSTHGWRFEGDDGILLVARSALDRFREAFAHFGVAMSMCTSELPTGFLHQELVDCGGQMQVFRNPLDLLANLTAWIKCDGSSIKHDTDMLLARAASYFYMYRRIPIIGTACWAVLRRYSSRWWRLVSRAAAGARDVAAVHLREFWSRLKGDYGSALPDTGTLTRWKEWALGRIQLAPDLVVGAEPPECHPSMLSHCCVELGCSLADLSIMADNVGKYFSTSADGPLAQALDLPQIQGWLQRQRALGRMVVEKVEDVREQAKVRAAEVYSVASAKVADRARTVATWCSHLAVLTGTSVLVYQLRVLFVLFGWSSVPLYPVLISLFIPLFMLAVGIPVYLVLHWGLQLPKSVARGIITGAAWTVLVVEVSAAYRAYSFGADGLARLIDAGGHAPQTLWTAASGILASTARGVLRRVL